MDLKTKNKEASHAVGFHLYEMSRIDKSIEKGNRLMVTQGWPWGGYKGMRSEYKRLWGSYKVDENVLKLNSGDGCTLFKYTKNH